MKMSESFSLPLFVQKGGVMPVVHDNYGAIVFAADLAKEAAHAINCHDELVTALKYSLEDYSDDMPLDVIKDLQELLNKAKGIEQ